VALENEAGLLERRGVECGMHNAHAHDPRFLRGIEHFNRREFFEAHEIWEDQWRDDDGPTRLFIQGLIQAAICLHHLGNGNLRGAKKLYVKSRGYLDQYRPRRQGLDVDQFIADMDQCCGFLLNGGKDPSPGETRNRTIPTIRLDL
jgi:predicted metal-dependent hydrolase